MSEQIKAAQAQQLLDNDVFKEALEQVTRGINKEMDSVKPGDTEKAMYYVTMRQAANRIIQHIISVAEDPKITEFNAKRKRRLF